MPKELIKNTGIYIIVGFLSQGIIFLLWIILARFLAPSQIGVYALVMFIIQFFGVISIFGLSSVITRFYYTKESISSILSNALTIFIGSSFLSLILFFFTAKFIPLVISGMSDILEKNLFLFLAIIFVDSIANLGLVHYSALKKAIIYTKLQLFKVLSFCVLSFILIYFGLGILGLFYALLFSSLLAATMFLNNERKIISFQIISPQIIRKMISYGFPLMLYGFMGVIIMYFSRILLGRYADLATLGVYSFFLTLTLQVNGLWGGFNKAWTPEIFSKFLKDKKKTIENVKFMTFLSSFLYLSVFALLIILGKLFLFKLIFKEIYLLNISIFYILLLGPLFTGIYTVVYPLFYYKKRTKRVLFVSLMLNLFNISLSFFMVKLFSQTGAALSYFIMSVLMVFSYLFAFKKIMQIPSKIISWAFLLSGLMILGVITLLKTSSPVLFLMFIILGAVLSYKIGELDKKKYLLFDFLRDIKFSKFL